MLKLIDATGLFLFSWMIIRAVVLQEDPLWLAAIITVVCFWIAVRTVAVCTCGGHVWPAPGLMFLLLCMISNHLGAYFHYYHHFYTTSESAWTMIWGFNLAYIGFAVGTIITARLSGIQMSRLVERFYSIPIQTPKAFDALVLPALILFLLSIGLSLLMLGGQLPILSVFKLLFSGRFTEASFVAMDARTLMHTAREYRFQGYLNLFRVAVLPMITILWFVCYRVSRRTVFKYLMVISILITSFMLVSILERSGLILFIIQLVIAAMLITKPKISLRWMYAATGMFGILIMLSLLLGRRATSGSLVENVSIQAIETFNRIYVSNSLSSAKTFEQFPRFLEFRWGGTWLTDIKNLLPGPGEGLSREIYTLLWPGSGTASPHFIAEMWANGGFLFIILTSLATGCFLQWLSVRLLSLGPRTPISITFITMVSYCFAMLGLGGFTTPMNKGLLVFVALYLVFNQFVRIGSRFQEKNTPGAITTSRGSISGPGGNQTQASGS